MLGNVQVVLLVVVSVPCFGQKLEFGIKGGIPVTSAFQTGSFFTMDFGESASSATRRYTVGPMVELRLPHGFELEFDVLYSRLGFADLTKSVALIFDYANTSANSWSFPVLAKYRLPAFRVVRPYIEVGPSFRTVSGVPFRLPGSLSVASGLQVDRLIAQATLTLTIARMLESPLDWECKFGLPSSTSPRR